MKRLVKALLLTLIASALSTYHASAHFVWVTAVDSENQESAVRVYFSESPDPGEPHLVSKIAGVKAWSRTLPEQQPKTIPLQEVTNETEGWLQGPISDARDLSLETVSDYGVVNKGGKPFLLQYYAKYVKAQTAEKLRQLGSSKRFPLDIVPKLKQEGIVTTVLWKGEPLAKAEIVIHLPDGEMIEQTTNDKGQTVIAHSGAGLYGMRARHIEPVKSGEREGKQYQEVRHYTTLTIDLPLSLVRSPRQQKMKRARLSCSARRARPARSGTTFPVFQPTFLSTTTTSAWKESWSSAKTGM